MPEPCEVESSSVLTNARVLDVEPACWHLNQVYLMHSCREVGIDLMLPVRCFDARDFPCKRGLSIKLLRSPHENACAEAACSFCMQAVNRGTKRLCITNQHVLIRRPSPDSRATTRRGAVCAAIWICIWILTVGGRTELFPSL